MQSQFIKIAPNDNVAIALVALPTGTIVNIGGHEIKLSSAISPGHKFSLVPIEQGQDIIKYGFCIGSAKSKIGTGEWIHTHNLGTNLGSIDERFDFSAPNAVELMKSGQTFDGFVRKNGSIGIRNEIWILPTVGCVASLAQKLAKSCKFDSSLNIDGCYAFGHQFGCSQLGDDLAATRNIIASLACHPNAGGVLIIGLGCENNQLAKLLEAIPKQFHYKIRYFEAQQVSNEFEHGQSLLSELVSEIGAQKRKPVGIEKLVLGVKCGGSDGFSGLTANPIIGRASDFFTQHGAKVIMTEIPEVFGAEQTLFSRCADRNIFLKLSSVIKNFKDYFTRNNQPIYENPSPGNKEGGITTLEEKSLGAVQKGGNAIITSVLDYGELADTNGLSVLNAPGNDAISSTALAASGAHIILFSTGRGTPLGFMVPTLKIASNSALAQNKPHWIDFDAGSIATIGNLENTAADLIKQIISIANGATTKNEQNQVREFAIWKNGVTL